MTDALADELERLKTLIASFPAHAQDMGPDNTVFADHIPMDGAEIGECPRPIERLAEAILSALREREPVAWRWRLTDRAYGLDDGVHGKWRYDEPPSGLRLIEVQPLYTAPTHQEEQS